MLGIANFRSNIKGQDVFVDTKGVYWVLNFIQESDMAKAEVYQIGKISLQNIRNNNELRVIKILPEVLAEFPQFNPDELDIQDIYALTLNTLPPRYRQKGTLVLAETVRDDEIKMRIKSAIYQVQKYPNHG